MNRIRQIILGVSVLATIGGTIWAQGAFRKLKDYKAVTKENKALVADKKALQDSLRIHKEWLAKSLIDTRNATELYSLSKGMTASFQSVIAVMRDSVIKINRDRSKLEARVLELQKDLEKARQKKKLF